MRQTAEIYIRFWWTNFSTQRDIGNASQCSLLRTKFGKPAETMAEIERLCEKGSCNRELQCLASRHMLVLAIGTAGLLNVQSAILS